jgi:hypothetical protein
MAEQRSLPVPDGLDGERVDAADDFVGRARIRGGCRRRGDADAALAEKVDVG